LCAALLHAIQPELSPIDDAVSYYMNGRSGWVLGLGLVAMGVGSLCLALGLRGLGFGADARAGLWALAVWGVGAAIGGMFAPDPRGHWDQPPSISGMTHGIAAMVAFLAFPVASLRLSKKMGGRLLPRLAVCGAVLLAAFFLCLAPVFFNRPPFALGLVERILLAVMAAWLIAAGFRVRQAAKGLPILPLRR
jgi:hypothetical membrane protein